MNQIKKPYTLAINLMTMALMFVFLSLFGGQMNPVYSATTVNPCCIEGDDGCSENGAVIDELAKAQAIAVAKKQVAAAESSEQSRQHIVKSKEKNLLGDLVEIDCSFSMSIDILEAIKNLMTTSLNIYIALIKAAISAIINAGCNLVVSMVNNALDNLCIPMPSLPLPQFTFGGGDRKYCDGIGGSDLVVLRRENTQAVKWLKEWPPATDLYQKVPYVRELFKGEK